VHVLGTALLMAPSEGGSPGFVLFLNLALFFLIIYFLLIRPQRKEQQKHQEMVASLVKGDEIVTSGGIIGTIVHVTDEALTVKTGENTRIVIQRNRVSSKLGDG
jgi:preprotein translocase subunit YajC